MEAVANNEVLPGVVLKQFVKDFYRVVQKVDNSVRSILSRIKALQAIRNFSKKNLNAFLGNEPQKEQVVETSIPQEESSVVVETVSEEVVPTESNIPVVPETVPEDVRPPAIESSIYDGRDSRVVATPSEIAKAIRAAKYVIDKPKVEKQEELPVQNDSQLQSIPPSEPLPNIEGITKEVGSETQSATSGAESPEEVLRVLNAIVEDNKNLKANIIDLQGENTALKEQVETFNVTNQELDTARRELIEFGEALKQLKAENDSLKTENTALKQAVTDTESKLNEMTTTINSVVSGYKKAA